MAKKFTSFLTRLWGCGVNKDGFQACVEAHLKKRVFMWIYKVLFEDDGEFFHMTLLVAEALDF